MVKTFQIVALIMKCTIVPLISISDGYIRYPLKQFKIYKIWTCNFDDKIYTIDFNIWLIWNVHLTREKTYRGKKFKLWLKNTLIIFYSYCKSTDSNSNVRNYMNFSKGSSKNIF